MPPPAPRTPYMMWRADPAQARLPPDDLPEARRNFGCPHRATAKGALHCGGGGLLQSVQDLLPLAAAMRKTSKTEGEIPAGYTYLGQLLAHDLCGASEGVFDYPLQGEVVPVAQPGPRPGPPLHLATLFGPLQDLAPLPELWRFAPMPAQFPFVSLDLRRGPVRARIGRSLAPLPDLRNEDTPMIAQLSALFVALAARLEAAAQVAGQAAGLEGAQARLAGRVAAVRIWHRILQRDYLPRMCLPGLNVQGLSELGPDHGPDHGATPGLAHVPVELTHAVLRCGHWMVRSQYRLNDSAPVTMGDLLAGEPDIETRRSQPGSGNFWRIDWRLFFEMSSLYPPQRALAMGDGIAAMFGSDLVLPDSIEIHSALVRSDNDLALRDVTRSLDGGLQRVSMLARRLAPRLKRQHPDWVLWSAARRKAMVRAWCAAAGVQGLPRHLIDDPPLYLYLLAEAGAGDPAQGFGNGKTLGALGSAVLAASINGAIAASAAALPQTDLPDHALPGADLDQMPDLIRHLTL